MSGTIIQAIKAAQAAPADDYMVWAVVETRAEKIEVISHTVRLPQSIPPENVVARIREQVVRVLRDNGFTESEIQTATIHMAALPSAEEVVAELEEKRHRGDLALVDLACWESCKSRLRMVPQIVDGELEMDYKGMKIRRSAVM